MANFTYLFSCYQEKMYNFLYCFCSYKGTMERVAWKRLKTWQRRRASASPTLTRSTAMLGSRALISCYRSYEVTCPKPGSWPVSVREWRSGEFWWPWDDRAWWESFCWWEGEWWEEGGLSGSTCESVARSCLTHLFVLNVSSVSFISFFFFNSDFLQMSEIIHYHQPSSSSFFSSC